MACTDTNADCAKTCLSIAAVAGLVAAGFLYWVTDIAAVAAIFVGVLGVSAVGFDLRRFVRGTGTGTGAANVHENAVRISATAKSVMSSVAMTLVSGVVRDA